METREATNTNDENIERWNNQSERGRQYWLTIANSARPIDAWRVFKRLKETSRWIPNPGQRDKRRQSRVASRASSRISMKFLDVRNAFDFVSLGQPGENEAYLDRETGAIYWQRDNADLCDPRPEDIGDIHRYVAMPHKTDLGLGKPLALQFTAKYLPAQLETVRDLFTHPDAVARFKELLRDQAMLSAWQTYEQNWRDAALCQWCADRGIVLQE